jgi:hypothetical protein
MEKTIKTIKDVLTFDGVTDTTLTPREKKALDEEGYVLFPDFIAADIL